LKFISASGLDFSSITVYPVHIVYSMANHNRHW
jgi:hypothetical protein